MDTITATHLRRELSAVLDAVLSGRSVQIERNGRVQAVIMPAAQAEEAEPPEGGET